MNDHGRELQAKKGMEVPGYQTGGNVPFIAGPMLTDPEYAGAGKWITKGLNALTGDLYSPYVTTDEIERWGDKHKSFGENLATAKKQKRNQIREENREERWEEGTGKPPPPSKPSSARKYIRSGIYNPNYSPRAYEQWKKDLKAYNEKYGQPSIWDKIKYRQEGGWITDALLDRLAEVESGGNNKAVSPAGAVGKYQWLPSSAKQAGYGVKPFDPLDEKAARMATAQYLKNMQKHHGFTPEETLRAYNWGPGNVINYNKGKRKDIPAEALNYPGKILGVENIEGVPVHGEMPLPTPRPTGRPEGGTNQDDLKAFLDKYLAGGGMVNYLQPGGYPNPNLDPVPEEDPYNYRGMAESIDLGGEEDIDLPSNVVPELQDVPGNPMYEGDTPTDESGSKWWHNLLGHRSKENLGLPLDENEQRLATEGYKDWHAANPSLVDDDPVGELSDAGIEGPGESDTGITGVTGEALVGQVDDMDPKFNKELKDNVKEETIKKIDEETKDATSVKEDDKTIEKKANENPGEIAKAEGFLKGILGDLFDTKELKRAAVMYVGSRLLGYDHQGSLRHSMKNYVTRVDAKVANKEKTAIELTKTGKYTPASIQAFKESGDVSVLQGVDAPSQPLGNFKTFFKGGKQVRAQEFKVGDAKVWQTSDGKIVDATYTDDPSTVKNSPQYNTRVKQDSAQYSDMIKGLRSQFGTEKTDDGVEYATELTPAIAGNKIARWGIENKIPAELMGSIVENAYHSALTHTQNTGEKIRDLTPFLEKQWVVSKVGDASLFTKPDGNVVSGTVVSNLMKSARTAASNLGGRTTQHDILAGYRKAWNDLSEKERKHWNAQAGKEENGFVKFMQTDIYKTL